jgi:uncharacterized membrane protein YuzA (DUF378 family)
MSRLHRSSSTRLVAALLAGLAGFFAFNVVDGVFGLVPAILGVVACVATTVFVFWRAAAAEEAAAEEPDA